MAFLAQWYGTNLPKNIIEILEKDILEYDNIMDDSKIGSEQIDKNIRNSKNTWIPTSHWIGGFVWHYVSRANRENFQYDLTCIDGEALQYAQYSKGEFYNWHIDGGLSTSYRPQLIIGSDKNISNDLSILEGEYVRKLSFIIQLSDPEDYTGGEVQFLDSNNKTFFAPKQRGTMILFDSRTPHRVRKIKSGIRRSLVGWCCGPRWK